MAGSRSPTYHPSSPRGRPQQWRELMAGRDRDDSELRNAIKTKVARYLGKAVGIRPGDNHIRRRVRSEVARARVVRANDKGVIFRVGRRNIVCVIGQPVLVVDVCDHGRRVSRDVQLESMLSVVATARRTSEGYLRDRIDRCLSV